MLHLRTVEVNDVDAGNRDSYNEPATVNDADRDRIVVRLRVRTCAYFALLRNEEVKAERRGERRNETKSENKARMKPQRRCNRTFK